MGLMGWLGWSAWTVRAPVWAKADAVKTVRTKAATVARKVMGGSPVGLSRALAGYELGADVQQPVGGILDKEKLEERDVGVVLGVEADLVRGASLAFEGEGVEIA